MTDSPRVERAIKKHNALVTGLDRMQAKRLKLIAALSRNEKRIDLQSRAIARSGKRIDKLRLEGKTYTAGPTSSAVPVLVEAVAAKPIEHKLNDDVPSFGRKKSTPAGTQTEVDPPRTPTKPATADGAKPISDERLLGIAKAERARRKRRTPDDLRAELDARRAQ